MFLDRENVLLAAGGWRSGVPRTSYVTKTALKAKHHAVQNVKKAKAEKPGLYLLSIPNGPL